MKTKTGFMKTLKELEDMMEEAWNVPFAKNRLMMDETRLQNIISDLRLSLPVEMRKAQELLDMKDEVLTKAEDESNEMIAKTKETCEAMLAKARQNAAQIIADANEEQARLVDSQAVLTIAKERATEIVDHAKADSLKMRNVTMNYIEGVVNDTYKSLERALNSVDQLKETYVNDKQTEEK